jgi:O-methyltransferase
MTDLWDFMRGPLMAKALAAVADAGVPEALVDGPRSVTELDGRFGSGFWDWLAQHPAERSAFDAAMSGERDRAAERRGIVLDLPETVRDEAALGDRIEFVAGSFFESVPQGDAYVLSGILHDRPNEHAVSILLTIRASAPRPRPAADQRRDRARQRPLRREVARPPDARPRRRPRTRRYAVAGAARGRRVGAGSASADRRDRGAAGVSEFDHDLIEATAAGTDGIAEADTEVHLKCR